MAGGSAHEEKDDVFGLRNPGRNFGSKGIGDRGAGFKRGQRDATEADATFLEEPAPGVTPLNV